MKETHVAKMADPSQDMQDILSQFGLTENSLQDSQDALMVNALELETDRGNDSPTGVSQGRQVADERSLGMAQYELIMARGSPCSPDPQVHNTAIIKSDNKQPSMSTRTISHDIVTTVILHLMQHY